MWKTKSSSKLAAASAALFASLITAPPAIVQAQDEATRVDLQAVTVDGSWNNYQLNINTYAYCPITLEENGHLSISVQSFFSSMHYIYLLDKDYATVGYTSVYGKGAASPVTTEFSYDLTAGQYYIRVESWNDCSGPFSVKANFTPSSVANPEGGDSFQTAAPCNDAPVNGFLSSDVVNDWSSTILANGSQNCADYYVYQADNDGSYTVHLSPINPDARITCEIFDSFYQSVSKMYYPGVESYDLKAGTYYFCVASNDTLCGDYLLQIDAPDVQPAAGEELSSQYEELLIRRGESLDLSDGTELAWGSSNPQIAVVSQNGVVFGMSAGTVWISSVNEQTSTMTLYQITIL